MSRVRLVAVLGRIRRGALISLVFGLPLIYVWDVIHLIYDAPKLALLVTATSIAATARASEIVLGAPAGGLRRAAVPAAFVAVPAAVSWLATDYKSWGLLGAYARYEGAVPVLLVVTAGLLLADDLGPDTRTIARAFVSSAAAVGAFAVVQSVGLDPFGAPVVDYVPSTIGHPNFLGGFLAIALPPALAQVTSSTGRARYLAMAATVAVTLGIILSFSQGGWVATAAGLAVFGGAALARRRPAARLAGWAGAGALGAAAVGLVVVSFVAPSHPAVPATAEARGFWWRAAVSMAWESPVWGHGPNVYAIEGPHHRVPADAMAHDTLYADEPHSVPLGLFANHGLLGLGGFVALIVWTTRRALRAPGGPILDAFGAGAAAYFVQSLVSIDAIVLAFALWVCVAALARGPDGVDAREPVPGRDPGFARSLVAGGLVLAAAVGALSWSARYLYADALVAQADDAYRAADTEEALRTMRAALEVRDDHQYRHLYGSMLGAAALRAGPEGADEIEEMRDAFAYLDAFPEVRAISDLGEGLHQWSVYDRTLEAVALGPLRRALSLDEHGPTLRVLTAEALIRLDRPAEAVATIEEMVPLIEEFPELGGPHAKLWAILAIARFYEGDPGGARAALDQSERAAVEHGRKSDCHLLAARELIRRSGEPATRKEYAESSGGLLLCRPATLALLPGFHPHAEDESAR